MAVEASYQRGSSGARRRLLNSTATQMTSITLFLCCMVLCSVVIVLFSCNLIYKPLFKPPSSPEKSYYGGILYNVFLREAL